ncbi:thioredoxin [Streptomyces sp. NPDC005070]
MAKAKNVTDATFDADVVNSGKTVLVDFWAEWCGPCRAFSPVLDQIAAEHPDDIVVVKVNFDENPVTSAVHRISSIPTLKIYRDGAVHKTLVGAMSKPALKKQIAEFLPA